MSLERFKLDGKVAIITGSTGGLGFAMAKALAGAGANVALHSRNKEKADALVATIEMETGQRAIGVTADVTSSIQVDAMMQTVAEAFGGIDILINNAGINIRKPLEEYDELSWDQVQNTNLKAPYLCSKAVFPYMKLRDSGRIINVASMLGTVGLPGRSAYCASKGGLIQLSKVLALEWASHKITVNALCPGYIVTEMNQAIINNPETNQLFIDNTPLGRWGTPDELGGAVIFLASNASSFMTGSSLVIDGGWTAK